MVVEAAAQPDRTGTWPASEPGRRGLPAQAAAGRAARNGTEDSDS